jgi:SecD/SecF fusion protein
VTSGTVAAFLTILGYSLYDTVIVFDRVRENVPRLPRATFSQIVNRSMSEVLTRSLITGLSSVFLVTVLYIFGGATLKDFAFAMMVGLASGTYSSIFIASPVLTHWKEREPAYRRRRERIEEQMGGVVPAFPEENVVARVDGGPEEPVQAETPVPVAPAPSRTEIPGVLPEQPAPVAPPPAPAPARPEPPAQPEPPAPVGAPDTGTESGDGAPQGGDGEAPAGNGGSQAERPELSEASAAALRRAREQSGGRKKRKHGRNR